MGQLIDLNAITLYIYKMAPIAVEAVLGILLLIVAVYFLYLKRPQRKWIVRIWDQAADKRLIYIKKDILTETFFNNGKQVAYLLRDARCEVAPPPWESIWREKVQSKMPFMPPSTMECADYLRIEQEYIPIAKMCELGFNDLDRAEYLKELVDIRNKDPKMVSERYIYVPASKVIGKEIKYIPMDYDVNMQRINAIDNREKIYADKQKFWDQYGSMIIIGAAVVLVIVVTYMSFDYATKVINSAVGPLSSVAQSLQSVANSLGGIASGVVQSKPLV